MLGKECSTVTVTIASSSASAARATERVRFCRLDSEGGQRQRSALREKTP